MEVIGGLRFVGRRSRRAVQRGLESASPAFRRRKKSYQRDFLVGQGLLPKHHLLDIGCGMLRGGIPLIEYLEAGHYTGIEPRAEAIAEGREELSRLGLSDRQPRLIIASDPADAAAALDGSFDYVWAHGVLFHLTDELLDGYLTLVSGALQPSGRFYANVRLRDAETPEYPGARWKGYPVVGRSRENYEQAASDHGMRVKELGTVVDVGLRDSSNAKNVMLEFTKAG